MTPHSQRTYLITGVSGQDGFFTARHFLKKGAFVVGLSRTVPSTQTPHLALLTQYSRFQHVPVQNYQADFVTAVVKQHKPQRLVHCAGFSDVPKNEEEVRQCYFTNSELLEMVLKVLVQEAPECRLIFLSSAEIFGKSAQVATLNENSPCKPENEYGKSKVLGMQLVQDYRSTRGLWGCSVICFNHDSFLSPPNRLLRVVPNKLLTWKKNPQKKVSFFNTHMKRDWSHAADFASAFDLMLEQKIPQEYVLASGKPTTLEQMIRFCCEDLHIDFEQAVETVSVLSSEDYDRLGDSSRIQKELGWVPRYDLAALVRTMTSWQRHRMRTQ